MSKSAREAKGQPKGGGKSGGQKWQSFGWPAIPLFSGKASEGETKWGKRHWGGTR